MAHNIKQIFALLSQEYQGRGVELEFTSTWQLLVAVMLSAQSTDIAVNKVTRVLFPVAPTPEKIIALGENSLQNYIKAIGLFRTKAKNIITTAKIILEHYNGEVPDSFAKLTSLPGVGSKTANVILNVAFGQATIPVDTHVFRVANRTMIAPGKTVQAVEQALLQNVPKQWQHQAHILLVLHGRYCCKARNPNCEQCCLHNLCNYRKNDRFKQS